MHLHCRIGMQNSRIHEPNLQPVSRGETGCNRRKRIRITCLPYAPKRKATFCEFHIRLLERKFLCSTIKFTVRLLSAKKSVTVRSKEHTGNASSLTLRHPVARGEENAPSPTLQKPKQSLCHSTACQQKLSLQIMKYLG
jgi:hypothetical protein